MTDGHVRRQSFFQVDDIALVVDPEGDRAWYRVGGAEPLNVEALLIADASSTLVTHASGNTPYQTGYLNLEFLQPQREDRLFQVRPYLYAIDRANGDKTLGKDLPGGLQLQVEHPIGTKRFGSDVTTNALVVNSVAAQNVGGVAEGAIPGDMIPVDDDMSDLFDLFCIYGTYPAINVRNYGVFTLGGTYDRRNWYLGFLGMKYMLADVDADQLATLHEAFKTGRTSLYKKAVVGGIRTVTTRA